MTGIQAVAERVAAGDPISEIDARLVLDTPDLITVGVMADEVRRRLHGTRTTFVRVFELHVDAIPAVLPPRVTAGEFRLVGVPRSLDAALEAVQAAARLAGGAPLTGFSLADLQSLASGSLGSVCGRLRDAGLECIAHLPIDRVLDPQSSVLEARAAGLGVPVMTVDSLAAGHEIELVLRARDLQTAVGGFRAFAPLPRLAASDVPSTGYDDVKHVAVARLVAGDIPSIQVDWVRYGPKLAQVALTMGADDIDGVAAHDPGVLGTRRSPIEEIRGNIRAAGLEAVERTARFEGT